MDANQTKGIKSPETAAQRILLFDAESFPNEGWTWGTWDQKVIEVIRSRMICSIAWQWYPSREKFVMALPDFPGYDPRIRTNKALMKAFHAVIDNADVAIGHNINEFDNPMINTDFIKNGLLPPAPHKTVDTLQVLKNRFRFNSNKLDDVCRELGIGKKVKHTGFDLWKGCMDGDRKSWGLMKQYNLGDVDPLLRGLYEHVRPWVRNHPNLTAPLGIEGCPYCRSKNVKRNGWAYTQTGKNPRFLCRDCGKYPSGRYVKSLGRWRFT